MRPSAFLWLSGTSNSRGNTKSDDIPSVKTDLNCFSHSFPFSVGDSSLGTILCSDFIYLELSPPVILVTLLQGAGMFQMVYFSSRILIYYKMDRLDWRGFATWSLLDRASSNLMGEAWTFRNEFWSYRLASPQWDYSSHPYTSSGPRDQRGDEYKRRQVDTQVSLCLIDFLPSF